MSDAEAALATSPRTSSTETRSPSKLAHAVRARGQEERRPDDALLGQGIPRPTADTIEGGVMNAPDLNVKGSHNDPASTDLDQPHPRRVRPGRRGGDQPHSPGRAAKPPVAPRAAPGTRSVGGALCVRITGRARENRERCSARSRKRAYRLSS